MGTPALTVLVWVFSVNVIAASAWGAEQPFYQGKNVTFVVNFAAGGPTDSMSNKRGNSRLS